jgi:hypothetical protein
VEWVRIHIARPRRRREADADGASAPAR